jgi:hypothetical protein
MVTWLWYFWMCGKAEHDGREYVLEQSYSSHGGQKQREIQEGSGGPNMSFKGTPWMTYFLK